MSQKSTNDAMHNDAAGIFQAKRISNGNTE
jgi:hypothetical protein